MARWAEFEAEAPDIAAEGRRLLYARGDGEALLVTVRGAELPRVHPINVGVVDGDGMLSGSGANYRGIGLSEPSTTSNPADNLDALAMMIIGMVLYRSGILTRPAPRGRYLTMVGAGFAIGLPLAVWQTNTLFRVRTASGSAANRR